MTDPDDLDELGFEPAVPATGADRDHTEKPRATRPGKRRTRSRLTRRLGAVGVLFAALAATSGAYAAFAASSTASTTNTDAASVAAGRQLYQSSCITCHGANLQGVKGNGPPLIGVGAAATYFQVSTGRMPVAAQGAYEPRKEAKFDETQTRQLAAYVESVGGGPNVPYYNVRGGSDTISEGGRIYRLNCASCHGTTGKGAPLSAGKIAPSLNAATDRQI